VSTGTISMAGGAGTALKSEHKTACATRTRVWESGDLICATRPMEGIIWNPGGPFEIFIKEGDAMIILSAREIDQMGVSVYEFELLYGGIVVSYSVIMEHNFDVEYNFPFEVA